MITQKKDELLQLPPGVAYTLQPNQMVRLEMHYINATQGPLTLTGSSTMKTAPTLQGRGELPLHRQPRHQDPGEVDLHARADLLQARPGRLRRRELLRLHRPRAQVRHQRHGADGGERHRQRRQHGLRRAELGLERAGDGVPRSAGARSPTSGGFSFTCDWDNTSPADGQVRRVGEQRDVLLLGLLLPVEGRLRVHAHGAGQRPRLLLPRRRRVRVHRASARAAVAQAFPSFSSSSSGHGSKQARPFRHAVGWQ